MKLLSKIKQIPVTTITLSLFASMLICFFAPLELYLSNKSYFFFGGDDVIFVILPAFLFVFVVFTLLFALISIFVPSRIYHVIAFTFLGLIIAIYIQGNMNPTNYGQLDGSAIDWSRFKIEGIISLLTFILLPVAFLFLSIKIQSEITKAKIINTISICMFLMLTTTLVILLFNNGLTKKPVYVASSDGQLSLSKDENIVILMLDSFDSLTMSELIDEEYENCSSILEDFTFYHDTSGMYNRTALAVPHFLSGVEYDSNMTYGEYLSFAYNNSPLLATLSDNDWDIGLYTTEIFPDDSISEIASNTVLIHRCVSSHVRLAKYMYRLVGFRYAPQQLKQLFWFYTEDENGAMDTNRESIEPFDCSNQAFLKNIDYADSNNLRKTFRFIHLHGAHIPYNQNENLEICDDPNIDEKETGKGLLKLIDKMLIQLKNDGTYDNSTIIICADHGMDNHFAPLFMVKGKNDSHPLSVSNDAFSFAQLQDVLCGVINNKDITSQIKDLSINSNERYVTFFPYVEEIYPEGYIDRISKISVNGPADDYDSFNSEIPFEF